MKDSMALIPTGTVRRTARGAGTGPRKLTIMAAMALSLLASSLVLADPPADGGHDRGDHREWRHDQGEHRDERRDERHHDRDERRDERWREHREHEEHRYRERFDSGRYERPRGWYEHEWRRGERLPIAYRESAYVIPDIAVYHLRPPPPGYYWVRVDNNAVLAAVATGVVVDVAFHLFH
jgi:Ni/Co efflux regulator RcnB